MHFIGRNNFKKTEQISICKFWNKSLELKQKNLALPETEKAFLTTLVPLNRRCWQLKSLVISHVDSFVLYGLQSDEIEIMMKAAEQLIKNPKKNTFFLEASIDIAVKPAPTVLTEPCAQYGWRTQPWFHLSDSVRWQDQAPYSQ